MRVTLEVKRATRERILAAAGELFETQGFDQTTTRDLSKAAGIATGTLFNYFPSKEAIVVELVDVALEGGEAVYAKRKPAGALHEDLFSYIATGLRVLRPCRRFLAPAVDTTWNPAASSEAVGARIRTRFLDAVQRIVARHLPGESLTSVTLQICWTLHTGVLSFWIQDESPRQEDTLALLDGSVRMFVDWLANSTSSTPPENEPPSYQESGEKSGLD